MPERTVMKSVKRVLAEQGRDLWTETIVKQLADEDRFYPAVYAALRKLEKHGEVKRVPHPATGPRGPVLWRLVAETDLDKEAR